MRSLTGRLTRIDLVAIQLGSAGVVRIESFAVSPDDDMFIQLLKSSRFLPRAR
jgi:hypothetical protein